VFAEREIRVPQGTPAVQPVIHAVPDNIRTNYITTLGRGMLGGLPVNFTIVRPWESVSRLTPHAIYILLQVPVLVAGVSFTKKKNYKYLLL